jgi:hypothetical protein
MTMRRGHHTSGVLRAMGAAEAGANGAQPAESEEAAAPVEPE